MENRIILYNDDCMKVMRSLSNDSVDLIVTDPPYRTTSRGNAGTAGGMCQKELYSKGTVFEHNNIDCKEYAPEFYRLLKWGASLRDDQSCEPDTYAQYLYRSWVPLH